MAMGSIFWEQGAYSALEQLFKQSAEFCSEHEVWKFNVAHTFFMQVCDIARYWQGMVLWVPAMSSCNLL